MAISKSVLITGANKGIGFQIAEDLGKMGFYIFLGARNEKRGNDAMQKLIDNGIEGEFVLMDVSNPQTIQTAFEQVCEKTGHLDVLINNAGILLDDSTAFLKVKPEVSLETMKINALGPLWVVQTFRSLLRNGSRVVMMSSGAGTFCSGIGTWAPVYSISKTALNVTTLQLHAALQSSGILINAMCPGWVRTDMGGAGAGRSVEKGAETAVWLATESPASINGKFLRDKKEIEW
ncbi:MAG: SDR family NAD(P)-dependent oxidoreductase [Bacteroidota bacterium]